MVRLPQGRIERGVIKTGEEVEIIGLTDEPDQDDVHGRRGVQQDIGRRSSGRQCRLSAAWRQARGDSAWSGAGQAWQITPHTKFEAEVYVLSKEEGGRHTPFFSGYRPQFYFRTTDVTGTAILVGDAEMCMPGDNAS